MVARKLVFAGAVLSLLLSLNSAEASLTATSIGVEFGLNGTHGVGSGLAPTDVAGVVPSANWNLASGDNGGPQSVVQDSHGVSSATSVSVSWSSSDTWNNGGTANFANANDNVLNNGYLDGGYNGVTTATVTFSGLSDALTYNVYVTSTGGTAETKGGNIIVNGVNDNGLGNATNTSGAYVQTTPSSGGNYHLFWGVAPVGGQITIESGLNFTRIPINSVELVRTPEPASLAIWGVVIAGGLLAARRRKA